MSAGAPCRICVSSTFEPAKLYCSRRVVGLEHLGQRGRRIDVERPPSIGRRPMPARASATASVAAIRMDAVRFIWSSPSRDRPRLRRSRSPRPWRAGTRRPRRGRRTCWDSAPTCCATFAAIAREQRAVRGESRSSPQRRGRPRGAAASPSSPSGRDRLRAREPVLRPDELEVLGERRGLAGVREQLRERGLVLARVQRSARELSRAGAVHDLRRLGPA